MSRLCLATYLQGIILCKVKSETKRHTVTTILRFNNDEFPEDDTVVSNISRGRKNPPRYVTDGVNAFKEENYDSIIEYFRKNVLPIVDTNKKELLKRVISKIILEDDSINDSTVVNIITGCRKQDLRVSNDSVEAFLAGILLYVLRSTDNNDKREYVEEINEQFASEAESIVLAIEDPRMRKTEGRTVGNKELNKVVKEFCTKHERELGLLPVCQIVHNINPLKNHIRSIYNDYNMLTDKNREKVLKVNNVPIISFCEDKWLSCALNSFNDYVIKNDISSCSFLYDGAKYYHLALDCFPGVAVDDPEPYIFETRHKISNMFRHVGYRINMAAYIYEYLYDRKEKEEYVPPWDCMASVFDLRNADSEVMSFCVCSFILSACKTIPKNVALPEYLYALGDYEMFIERQEDLYYWAALYLYAFYELNRRDR